MNLMINLLLAIGCGIAAYYCLLLIAHILTHLAVLIGRIHVSK